MQQIQTRYVRLELFKHYKNVTRTGPIKKKSTVTFFSLTVNLFANLHFLSAKKYLKCFNLISSSDFHAWTFCNKQEKRVIYTQKLVTEFKHYGVEIVVTLMQKSITSPIYSEQTSRWTGNSFNTNKFVNNLIWTSGLFGHFLFFDRICISFFFYLRMNNIEILIIMIKMNSMYYCSYSSRSNKNEKGCTF